MLCSRSFSVGKNALRAKITAINEQTQNNLITCYSKHFIIIFPINFLLFHSYLSKMFHCYINIWPFGMGLVEKVIITFIIYFFQSVNIVQEDERPGKNVLHVGCAGWHFFPTQKWQLWCLFINMHIKAREY